MSVLNRAIPKATVSLIEQDAKEIQPVSTRDLFTDGVYILVGVPGAFTPICTHDHLPTLIESADNLKVLGIQEIYCVSDDNPWAIDAWRKTLNNHKKIKFLCDGNRALLDALKLSCHEEELFLSGKYARFYAIIENGIIRLIRQEASVLETVCTAGDCIESDVKEFV